MRKKIIAIIMCISMMWTSIPYNVLASESNILDKERVDNNTIGEVGGFLASNVETVKRIHQNKLFTTPKGHGFAAERANNLYDAYKGIKGTVVGDDFLKNGPDRKIINRNGTEILVQDKYYLSAKASVEAAFDENGIYKYVDADEMPMKLEVPKDQYDEAVQLMREKIKNGKIRNITDPDEATNIVKKGSVTYQQAVNIAKAGNIDSLMYDAANGVVSASCAAGIGFVIDYAVCRMNGLEAEAALNSAITNGLKTGGVVFATFVISSQIARTGAVHALAPTSEALAKALGDEVCEAILVRTGIEVTEAAASEITSKVAKVLSKELITEGVMIVVLTAVDVTDLFRGRISEEELLKNLTVTIVTAAAGTAGGWAGGALGNFVLPGAGAAIGTIVGSVLVGGLSGLVAELVADKVYESDADEMYKIISVEFQNLGEEYLITEDEGKLISEELSKELTGNTLKNMYASENRTQFALELMKPLFIKQVEAREEINVPTEMQMRAEYKAMMKGVIFIH